MTNLVRRIVVTAVGLAAVSLALAAPAGASVPKGWSDPAPMPVGKFLMIVVVYPVAAMVAISLVALVLHRPRKR